jgi:hypothetical protein
VCVALPHAGQESDELGTVLPVCICTQGRLSATGPGQNCTFSGLAYKSAFANCSIDPSLTKVCLRATKDNLDHLIARLGPPEATMTAVRTSLVARYVLVSDLATLLRNTFGVGQATIAVRLPTCRRHLSAF